METSALNTNMGTGAEASAIPPATGSSIMNVGSNERIASTVGGAALAIMALRDLKSPSGIGMLLAGGFLLFRGLSGFCAVNKALGRNTAHKHGSPVEVKTTVSLDKPRSEVYSFWRKLENLPQFMKHLEKVEELDQTKSRWTAKGPAGVGAVSWEAEIVEDQQNELISWRSLPGSTVHNAGEVRFIETPSGTDIKVQMSYRLPGGDIGGAAARLFSPMAEKMMRDDIKDLRNVLQNGSTLSNSRSKQNKTVEKVSGYTTR